MGHLLLDLLQLQLRRLCSLLRHLLVNRDQLQLILRIKYPFFLSLGQLLSIGEFTFGRDEIGLLLLKLGLEFGTEGYKGFCFLETCFKFADSALVVCAFEVRYSDTGTEFLELLFILDAL